MLYPKEERHRGRTHELSNLELGYHSLKGKAFLDKEAPVILDISLRDKGFGLLGGGAII